MLQALFEKHNSFLRPLKKKGFKEERVTTMGWYAIGTSTTLESNKSLCGLSPSETPQEKSKETFSYTRSC
jgi:hypothetical protein